MPTYLYMIFIKYNDVVIINLKKTSKFIYCGGTEYFFPSTLIIDSEVTFLLFAFKFKYSSKMSSLGNGLKYFCSSLSLSIGLTPVPWHISLLISSLNLMIIFSNSSKFSNSLLYTFIRLTRRARDSTFPFVWGLYARQDLAINPASLVKG